MSATHDPIARRPLPKAPIRVFRAWCLAALVLPVVGCQEELVGVGYAGTVYNQQDVVGVRPSGGAFGGLRPDGPGIRAESNTDWAIVLARFDGPDHRRQAEAAAQQFALAASFAKPWVQSDDEAQVSTVYHGRYRAAGAYDAQADLARWRELVNIGRVQLSELMLAPIIENATGGDPQHDLRVLASRIPADIIGDLYTLQIAYFDGASGEDFRRLAEERARQIRDEGYDAYYYHGPNMSMVTIGVFDNDALGTVRFDDDGVPIYGPQIEQIRARYPENLANGKPLPMYDDDGRVIRNQPSVAVVIPRLAR